MAKKQPIDIVTVNFNGLRFTPKFVDSLYRNTVHPFRLIVVDNQSTDGSAEWLEFAKQSYPNMTVYYSEQLNSGFSDGNNQGLKFAKSRYVCLINNDVIISQKGWLTELKKCLLKGKKRGIVSPKLLYPDGRIQYAGASFNKKGETFHIGRFKAGNLFNEEREVPTATFACVLIRRELLDGGLDEAYGLGTFEDVDFCCKTRKKGYSVWYCPSVTLYHYESATVWQLPMEQFTLQSQLNFRLFLSRWRDWLLEDMKANPEVYKK